MTTKNNIHIGYKNSTVGVIPQEWEVKQLIDLCHNTGYYGINAPAVTYCDSLPTYLRITDIDNYGKFIKVNKVSVNHPDSVQFILKDSDIVFARTGATVGKTYLYNPNDGLLVYAGFLICFSINIQKAIPYYIKTYTETSTYWNWVKIISQRSGQPGINATEFSSMQLPIPPLKEQQKIAEILSTWDEAIEKQSKLIEKLELRKRGIMQRLLTGRTRLPGFTTPWQKVKLGDICKETTIKNTKNAKYIVLSCTKYKGLVSSLEYFGKQIFSNDLKQYKIVPKNHFAYATNHIEEGSIGYQIDYDYSLISPMYTVFKTNENKINNHFLYALLKTPLMMYNYKSRIEGSIDRRGGLRYNTFAKIPILLPTLNEQNAISKILTTIDEEINIQHKKLETLRTQKRGLMQQLLTGKTRVKI